MRTPEDLVVVTPVPSRTPLVVDSDGGVGVIGTKVAVADGSIDIMVVGISSPIVIVTVSTMLRFRGSTGPKHDWSSLKSLREQLRCSGHGKSRSVSRGSHAGRTNSHRLRHVFTLVGSLLTGSVKHSGK